MTTKLHLFAAMCILAALAMAGVISPNARAQCNVYMATNRQVIDGFGFSSAWCGALTTAKNKSLYETLGMSLLRVQIMNDPDGAADGAWNAESNNAAAAHAYGAKVFGTDWFAPSENWDTNDTDYIMPQYYQADARWLAAAAKYHHLDWVSPANEPDLGWQQWTTNGFTRFTVEYGTMIGLPLIEPESCWFAEPYSETIADNPDASVLIPIAGGHGYGGTGTHPAELAAGKHLWMTEHYLTGGQDNIGECMAMAQEISQYINDQFSAYVWWWVYDSDTNCNLVDDNGNIHKNGYTEGQFARWVRPGSTVVSASFNPQSNVFVTAYNVNGSVIIVAVNTNGSSVNQQFVVHNGSAVRLEGYRTSSSLNMADIGSFTVAGGSFTASLPAQSVTTFVQTNGTSANLPPTWMAADLGLVGIVGSSTYTNSASTNGAFMLSGSGNDIWNTADAFRFVYQTNTGNCTIVARVSSEQSTNAMAKAGVMIRSTLASGAANAFVALTPSQGVTFQYRSNAGGATGSNLVTGLTAPYWVKLAGTNGEFTGFCSADGTSWTQLGTEVIDVGPMVYAGLAFCGNGNANLGTATFDNVSTPTWPIAPPLPPAGLTATAGVEQVALAWQEGSFATNYSIARSTTSGGPFTNIATVAGQAYLDADLAGGTTYYYVVTAANGAGQSTDSAPASATPTANVPAPWVAQDVGLTGAVGSTGVPGCESFSNGVFTVNGSGDDIWNSADAFRFVYVTTNSSGFTITARVTSVLDIDPWSKAGVMVRDSLNPGAANALVAVTPGNGVTFQYRASDGGSSANTAISGLSAPCWIKLARSGNTFTGYYSPDDMNWTQVGSATFTLPSTVYAGLAVTAHDNSSLCMATLEDVSGPGWTPAQPPVPGGLVAAGGDERVALSWLASSNAIGYNVYRATVSGGPYTLVANVAATNYNDIQLIGNGTTYYYVVTAVNNLAGESLNSAQVSATTIITAPFPWLTLDIGSPGVPGSAFYTNGVFTVNGSGADIWNEADSFQFVYLKTNTVNFTISARVVTLEDINSWSKAGVMVRDSLQPGAANAMIAVTPGNGVTFQYRPTDDGSSDNEAVSGAAPYWIKLIGSGTTFTGYCSPDGENWTEAGSTALTNITTAYIGLAVTAHNNSDLCAATFDNVSAPGWPLLPGVPGGLTAVAGNGQVVLSWAVVNGASSYNLKSAANSGGPYTILTNLAATAYTNTGLINGSTYYYVVSALDLAGESANSVEASATPQAPPQLDISMAGANLVFSWPVASAGFTLQSNTNLALSGWVNVTSPAPQIVGSQWQVALSSPAKTNSIFYRLVKQPGQPD